MKRIGIILLVFVGLIITLWVVGNVTHTLMFVKIGSVSMEPTLMKGQRFFSSNLVEPKRLNFICYYANIPETGRVPVVSRLCGIAGDTIQIRDGVLFVNGKNFDDQLVLGHDYFIKKKDYYQYKDSISVDEDYVTFSALDTCEVPLSDKFVKDNKIPARRLIVRKDSINEYIRQVFNKNFNQDNFGPVVIPKNKYFTIGDNRQWSMDSRYLGFIDKKDYIATFLRKK